MKVVLFCGGLGMRIREYSDEVPKPMVPIGDRPLLWHVMKYYAHHGHKDFILCLGYKAHAIKDYFLNYNECFSNDFTMTGGGRNIDLVNSDIHDWKITFADTGADSTIGERLLKVRGYLGDEDVFLANYADNLTDAPLPDMIDTFSKQDMTAAFLCVRPSQSFHVISTDDRNVVSGIDHIAETNVRINGGYFVFKREIFDWMRDGEDLVGEPFRRLIERKKLLAYPYDGFFMCMDTFKERTMLEELYMRGKAPWSIWAAHKR
jgi:glucose-1-phosphate cytidylyltransferase